VEDFVRSCLTVLESAIGKLMLECRPHQEDIVKLLVDFVNIHICGRMRRRRRRVNEESVCVCVPVPVGAEVAHQCPTSKLEQAHAKCLCNFIAAWRLGGIPSIPPSPLLSILSPSLHPPKLRFRVASILQVDIQT